MFLAHHMECELFSAAQHKPTIKHFGTYNPNYDCITPLRCLYLRDKEPEKWKKFCQLESNVDKRKNTPSYERTEVRDE